MLREKQQRHREGAPQTTGASHASVLGQTRSVRPPGGPAILYTRGLGCPSMQREGDRTAAAEKCTDLLGWRVSLGGGREGTHGDDKGD